jgi:hypothetical protein
VEGPEASTETRPPDLDCLPNSPAFSLMFLACFYINFPHSTCYQLQCNENCYISTSAFPLSHGTEVYSSHLKEIMEHSIYLNGVKKDENIRFLMKENQNYKVLYAQNHLDFVIRALQMFSECQCNHVKNRAMRQGESCLSLGFVML